MSDKKGFVVMHMTFVDALESKEYTIQKIEADDEELREWWDSEK